MSATEMLAAIAKEVAVCAKCTLDEWRRKAVPGEGPEAKFAFLLDLGGKSFTSDKVCCVRICRVRLAA